MQSIAGRNVVDPATIDRQRLYTFECVAHDVNPAGKRRLCTSKRVNLGKKRDGVEYDASRMI